MAPNFEIFRDRFCRILPVSVVRDYCCRWMNNGREIVSQCTEHVFTQEKYIGEMASIGRPAAVRPTQRGYGKLSSILWSLAKRNFELHKSV